MNGSTLGRSLRRFRRLQGIKQTHLAELLGISQGSLSRWESGTHQPDPAMQARIENVIAATTSSRSDAALKRLIETSPLRIHLICDTTHRLLAASPARGASWRGDVASYIGTSLWRFASPEIERAEQGLVDQGWFERPFQNIRFRTGPNRSAAIAITPGLMEWESILLADGRVGRLTTSVVADA